MRYCLSAPPGTDRVLPFPPDGYSTVSPPFEDIFHSQAINLSRKMRYNYLIVKIPQELVVALTTLHRNKRGKVSSLYATIFLFETKNKGCFATDEWFSKKFKVTPTSINTYLRWLEDRGFIERTTRGPIYKRKRTVTLSERYRELGNLELGNRLDNLNYLYETLRIKLNKEYQKKRKKL
jgi:hypothetical protein